MLRDRVSCGGVVAGFGREISTENEHVRGGLCLLQRLIVLGRKLIRLDFAQFLVVDRGGAYVYNMAEFASAGIGFGVTAMGKPYGGELSGSPQSLLNRVWVDIAQNLGVDSNGAEGFKLGFFNIYCSIVIDGC